MTTLWKNRLYDHGFFTFATSIKHQMQTNLTTARIQKAMIRQPEIRLATPIDWEIKTNENWAVLGPNGSGKTILAEMLKGKYPLQEGSIDFMNEKKAKDIVKSIAFKDIYSLIDTSNTYYQQRWHSTETDEIATVHDLLGNKIEEAAELFSLFHLTDMLEKKVIQLSSGELRKFLIIKVLLEHPRIVILDNPYIGLDVPSRMQLTDMLSRMSRIDGLQVILLLSNPDDIPDMITHVLLMQKRRCVEKMTRETYMSRKNEWNNAIFQTVDYVSELPYCKKRPATHEVTFRMENVSIRYGSRTILDNLTWEVRNGEKWALLGQNGTGKSTLLSLIYADNPQSYANTLYLFDRKRGSGESIWDIKKRIGYISPEMHLYYMENIPAVDIVGSGFFDSIGLYRKCNAEQRAAALEWMRIFGIEPIHGRSFLHLSSGEQRLVLLARSLVKNPDLLILDEPLHGLDVSNKKRAAHIINLFCNQPGKSMIYVTHYPNEIPTSVTHRFELVRQK